MPAISQSVSFEDGLRHCLGRTELYARIARRFLDTHQTDAERAQKALAARELDVLRKISHDMTSTAGTLGAGRLSAAALALQAGVEDGVDVPALSVLVRTFAMEHESVVAVLESHARGEVDLQSFARRNTQRA